MEMSKKAARGKRIKIVLVTGLISLITLVALFLMITGILVIRSI